MEPRSVLAYATRKHKAGFGFRPSSGQKNKKGGDNLLSHWASPAVPSASRDLTSVFGMGTGVTLRLSSPPIKTVLEIHKYKEQLKDVSKGRKSPKLEKEK